MFDKAWTVLSDDIWVTALHEIVVIDSNLMRKGKFAFANNEIETWFNKEGYVSEFCWIVRGGCEKKAWPH